jgi:4-amino-4-deoxy-L-arabinose transferase-like glycosyltransferase
MKAHRVLWPAMGLAFALALASAWFLGPHSPEDLRFDSVQYHTLALNLVRDHRYSLEGAFRHWPPGLESGREWYPDHQPETYWAPGYPAFMALVYTVTGPSVPAVLIAQSLLFCGTIWLVYGIVEYVTGSARVASITVWATACWPACYTVMMCSIMGEALFAFLTAAALAALIRCLKGGSGRWALLCGVLLGLAALTKPAILPFVPFAALFAAFTPAGRRWWSGTAVLVGFAVCLVPWVVRNRIATGRLIPVSTAGPTNLYLGNSPQYYVAGDINLRHWTDTTGFQNQSRARQEQALTRLALERMRRYPATAVALFVRKLAIMWLGGFGGPPHARGPVRGPSILGLALEPQTLLFIPAFVLSVCGWRRLSSEGRRRALLVVVLLVCVSFSYAATFSTMRYSVPLNPYMLGFAAAAFVRPRREGAS